MQKTKICQYFLTTILVSSLLLALVGGFSCGTSGVEARWPSRFPEHPELAVPIPTPEVTGTENATAPENNPQIGYDVATGEEITSGTTQGNSSGAAYVKGAIGVVAQSVQEQAGAQAVQPWNFSDLSLVSNREDYPWCVNVKLFIYFPGDPNTYEGSGVLIDPRHVLTAGHCVNKGFGGPWARDIIVAPAYHNESFPYGVALADHLYAWGGWTIFGNWGDDIGVIELDRPVGALTGWNGYGYNDTPSFYTGNTFYNPGYPGESPYDGEEMYYWSGNFDGTESLFGVWWGNQVWLNKDSYGGQSGSGAYHIDGTDQVEYAVLSNENPLLNHTNFPRITSAKFGDINNIIAEDTPSTFDLIPLDVKTSPATVVAGSQLSSMYYVVTNYASVSWTGTVNVDVYLSTDKIIDTGDTLIESHSFTYSFSPKSSVALKVSTPPTIPQNTPDGYYWVGVILDIADNQTWNNHSDGQDASYIHVSHNSPPNTPTNLSPANGATGVSINTGLSWSGGDPDAGDTVTYSVYFGPSSSPPLVSVNQVGTIYAPPGPVTPNTKYYWKVIVTDNHGASTTGPLWDFTTQSTPPGITVTSPNGGENWAVGSTHTITWTSSGVGNVNIGISRDGGSGWSDFISNIPNTGSYSWTVTGPATTQALIRITSSSDGNVWDTSNSNFIISSTPSITVTYPNGSYGGDIWGVGSIQIITWTSSGVTGNVNIDISRDIANSIWSNIASNIPNTGSYSWTVTGPATSYARIRVTSSSDGNVWDMSNGSFFITSGPWITVTSPNGGENWAVGSTHTITWTSSGVGNVNIGISTDGGSGWSDFISNTPNTGSYSWTVTWPATTQALIRITSSSDGNVWDKSNGNFNIF